jgi:hypothetical protein
MSEERRRNTIGCINVPVESRIDDGLRNELTAIKSGNTVREMPEFCGRR